MDKGVEVNRLVDLIEYQDGSIVSRIIMKGRNGNVTLFGFDVGQQLSEHTTPHDALAHVIDGEAEVTIAAKPYRLRPGEAVTMPAHQPHAVKAISRFKMVLTMIHP